MTLELAGTVERGTPLRSIPAIAADAIEIGTFAAFLQLAAITLHPAYVKIEIREARASGLKEATR